MLPVCFSFKKMKTLSILTLSFVILFTSMSAYAGIIDFSTSSHVNWKFIQSVGGMAVGEPREINKNEWFLPVECNIAGTREITIKPTAINSGLALKELKFKIKNHKIQLWVVTCSVTKKYNSGEATGVTFKNITAGQYQVEYLSSDGSTVPIAIIDIKGSLS